MNIKKWQKQIVYQIYPRSFKDSNGDGIGDLKGIISKLDYIKDLGATAIWISPCFASPMKDGGYDISDYRSIDPIFGTNADMDELLLEAKKRDIGIILDLVVNHTSDQHVWFQEALKGKDNPYHDYYVWRKKANTLGSVFGGNAWEYVPALDEYYLHLFAKEQPDLNWENPKLREDIYEMMNYWLDKGVYGFRMDVIENLGKQPDLLITTNGEHLHEYLQEMHQKVYEGREAFSVGECWGADDHTRILYTDPDRKELNMVFQFSFFAQFWGQKNGKWNPSPFDLIKLKEVLFHKQITETKRSWNANFWDNHDLPRATISFCKGMDRKEASKMLFAISCFEQGTPFIYQGDEIGMGHPLFLKEEEIVDVEARNNLTCLRDQGFSKEDVFKMVSLNCRDNARTPFSWDSTKDGGFSTGTPWLKAPADYQTCNVEEEKNDETSVLSFFKKMIAFRQKEDILPLVLFGDFIPLAEDSPSSFSFLRVYKDQEIGFIANFSPSPITNPWEGKEFLFGSVPEDRFIPSCGVLIYRLK